jgi:DsbC/DsbD-like thiol-disulfide interchange protein
MSWNGTAALAAATALFTCIHAAGAHAQTPVSATLRLDRLAGDTVRATVRVAVERGWKIYAQDPGEAGLPTRVEWRVPAGWTAGEETWPAPHERMVFDVAARVYERELRVLRVMWPERATRSDAAPLRVRVTWAACREVCIPGDTVLVAPLPVRVR